MTSALLTRPAKIAETARALTTELAGRLATLDDNEERRYLNNTSTGLLGMSRKARTHLCWSWTWLNLGLGAVAGVDPRPSSTERWSGALFLGPLTIEVYREGLHRDEPA